MIAPQLYHMIKAAHLNFLPHIFLCPTHFDFLNFRFAQWMSSPIKAPFTLGPATCKFYYSNKPHCTLGGFMCTMEALISLFPLFAFFSSSIGGQFHKLFILE